MDTSKAWLWGRIRERERERERGSRISRAQSFREKVWRSLLSLLSTLVCRLSATSVPNTQRGWRKSTARRNSRVWTAENGISLLVPPPPWNFRLFLLRNDNSIGACKWFKCKENRGLLVFFLPRLSFNLRYFQRRLYIRCENKFLPLCFYDRTLLAEFELVYHWWRHLKERSFVFEKSRDERSKSFQSYATISIWRARSVVRVTVYFLRYSLGDRLSKLLK